MSIWRTDAKGREVHLSSATTKRDFRLFDLGQLQHELADIRAVLRKPLVPGEDRHRLREIADRIEDVIYEKIFTEKEQGK